MPIALRGPRKAMREKCECGRGKCERGLAFSTPWPRFHGVDRADVYIIIRVRACCCGECALNSPTAQPIPRRRPSLAPAQRHALAEHFRPHAAPTHAHAVPNRARRLREAFPAATRCLSFRSASGTKKTAPHSACAMPNVSVDRRCGRSFGLVSRALFAAVAGRWRVGVGLRPQPWALRSRRCGRVLRA